MKFRKAKIKQNEVRKKEEVDARVKYKSKKEKSYQKS